MFQNFKLQYTMYLQNFCGGKLLKVNFIAENWWQGVGGWGVLVYSFYFTRRVHISEVTAKALGDQFQLEPGDGGDRDDYIREHKLETYLVVVPEVSALLLLYKCIQCKQMYWIQMNTTQL